MAISFNHNGNQYTAEKPARRYGKPTVRNSHGEIVSDSEYQETVAAACDALLDWQCNSADATVLVFGAYEIRDAVKAAGAKFDSSSRAWRMTRGSLAAVLASTGRTLKTGGRFADPEGLAVWIQEVE